jgi:predicted ester cyclase
VWSTLSLVAGARPRAAEPRSGARWEARARALHLAVDYPGSLRAYERAYEAYRREGELFGIPPSGRPVTMTGMEVYRLVDGRVAEFWGEYDMSAITGT